jgi:hypothetical protein
MGVKWALWSPYLREPTVEEIQRCAAANKMAAQDAFVLLHKKRNEIIRREQQDPLRYGWNAPMWRVCDALLDVPWCDKGWAKRMRDYLGFTQRVRMLLILGGNRAAKTYYCSKTMARLQWAIPGSRTWMFHMTHAQSVEYHHGLMWDFLPPELQHKQISDKTNISYGQKDGFTRDKYVLPNLSENSFRNYSQNRRDAIEGGEPNAMFADELIPGDWIETLMLRLATRDGFGMIGFTPVDGYSPTVRMFCDGAKPVRQSVSYLCPKDGGEVRPDLALGVNKAEYAELIQAGTDGRKPECVTCRPEDPDGWLTGGKDPRYPENKIADRDFELVPRVLKCVNDRWAVVYFHSSDNPFGNPAQVIENIRAKGVAFRKERFYGVAEKTVSGKFPLFNENVHIVKAASIPQDGTNYHFVDPSSARPFFMLWIRVTPQAAYVYREWPGNYAIPGMGVLGPWAEASGKATEFDGKKGPAQKSIGWGFLSYKEEIARLEGWQAYEAGKPEKMHHQDWIASLGATGPTKEKIRSRFMDARFGNVKSLEDGGMKTLLESFDEIGLEFYETTSTDGQDSIDTGCNMINDALFYDVTAPLSFLNMPKLFISEECTNLIFAMQIYTALDGQHGATKDPIDCLRYFFKKDCQYVIPNGIGGVAGRGVY